MMEEIKTSNKVTTIKGDFVNRNDCINIEGNFYKKNRDVVQLYNNPNGRWVRITHDWIGKDKYGTWIDKRNEGIGKVIGIIDILDDGSFLFGEFIKSNYTIVVIIYKGKKIYCLDSDTAKKGGFIESKKDDFYYEATEQTCINKYEPTEDSNFAGQQQSENNLYSVLDNKTKFNLSTRQHTIYPIVITDSMIKLGKIFPGYTFGLESEIGCLLKQIEMIGGTCLRDGSIKLDVNGMNGNEIASCVLSGAKGFQSVYNFYKLNNPRSYLNKTMGLHTHIAHSNMLDNYGRCRPSYIVGLYRLYTAIQDELNNLIPLHRRENSYCKKLPKLSFEHNVYGDQSNWKNKDIKSILTLFDEIWRYYSRLKNSSSTIGAFDDHKCSWEKQALDNKGKIATPWSRKWDSANRYSNLNLANMFWSEARTIEIRHWSATLNPYKIMANLLIGLCITKFSLDNEELLITSPREALQQITLLDIIDNLDNSLEQKNNKENSSYIKRLKIFLTNYIKQRTKELKLDITTEIKGPQGVRLAYSEYELDSLWLPSKEIDIFE